MRVELQPAFVLHRRDFRNSSLIVEAFTPGFGRIGMVARGVRRPRSEKNALLQSFRPLLISWTGKGELYTLTNVEAAQFVNPVTGSAYASCFYLNELVMRLLQRDDAHKEVYALYQQALQDIQTAPSATATERVLRLFEKQLLQELGYGLMLECEADSGQALDADGEYCYEPEYGPVLRSIGRPASGVMVSGQSLLSLARHELADARSLRDSKRLMRAVLREYLGDKPLQSRMLYTQARP
ncbi:DNA repair protein RecO [Sulfuriflexus sp.]|uniref:DNA repair protein RecO n=1 Tax=Sulfuriflexus sp. TaxID=2015443 RepID=UPI0028CCEA86|nr:DNA repair protein RecO [Sulfuriflexus sp.]MDT8404872.1 DNA repair protein RecO [Sulfuriflexus sp.]